MNPLLTISPNWYWALDDPYEGATSDPGSEED